MDNHDDPTAAHLGTQEATWAEASRARARVDAPIRRLHGTVKASTTRAHVAGGSTANGGPAQVGTEPVLFTVGVASTGWSLAGWRDLIGCDVARTIGPQFPAAPRSATREVRAAEFETRSESEVQVEDTIIMPVVGDLVHYSRGTGYLVGLQGVVVAFDDGQLPPGLRYVQFEDEEWPKVVAVAGLDRI